VKSTTRDRREPDATCQSTVVVRRRTPVIRAHAQSGNCEDGRRQGYDPSHPACMSRRLSVGFRVCSSLYAVRSVDSRRSVNVTTSRTRLQHCCPDSIRVDSHGNDVSAVSTTEVKISNAFTRRRHMQFDCRRNAWIACENHRILILLTYFTYLWPPYDNLYSPKHNR